MSRKYLHFTDFEGAEGIAKSGYIWQSSFGPKGAVFAVAAGAAWVPAVQMTKLGRAKDRKAVVVFTTGFLPDYAMPEEVMWHLDTLPVKVKKIISPSKAKQILDSSISEDPETEMLQIPLHPAFNILGEWARMPEGFEPWIPGKDNKKYFTARKIWSETEDVSLVREFWESGNETEKQIDEIIESVLNDILSTQ